MTVHKQMKIRNDGGGSYELFLYDEIGSDWFGGISAATMGKQLAELADAKDITLRVNSPGGDVFDGLAMYNLLARHTANISVKVDGLAASAASIVAMAGDSIEMADNALMMIHRAWTVTGGNAEQLRETAELLETIDGQILATYGKRATVAESELRAMLDAETWLTASEAVEFGLADSVTDNMAVAAHVPAGRYNRTPLALTETVEPEPAPAWRREAAKRKLAIG